MPAPIWRERQRLLAGNRRGRGDGLAGVEDVIAPGAHGREQALIGAMGARSEGDVVGPSCRRSRRARRNGLHVDDDEGGVGRRQVAVEGQRGVRALMVGMGSSASR